jgi:hypothetical protein
MAYGPLAAKTDPKPVGLAFGFGYNAPRISEEPLTLFDLLPEFGTVPALHNGQGRSFELFFGYTSY